jgi:hypothetical protein
VKDLARFLFAEIQAHAQGLGAPICYEPGRYPYFFNDLDGSGDCNGNEASFPNRYQAWDAALIKAAHNYQHSQAEPGAWAHNFAYICQLVIDSIIDLSGNAAPTNPDTGKPLIRPAP